MAKQQKRNQSPRRQRMKRPQRLNQPKAGWRPMRVTKLSRPTAIRYGVDFDCAFTELEMLGIPIDPDYKERVLQSVAEQAAAKRQKRVRDQARRADVWIEYADDETALERAGDCVSCDMFRPLDDIPLELAQRIAVGELPMSMATAVADLPEPKRTGLSIFILANEPGKLIAKAIKACEDAYGFR